MFRITIALFAAALALLAPRPAAAQLPQTRIYSVFPPGAKAGSTVEVQVTRGDDIDELDKLLFGHPGITAAQKVQEVDGQPQPVPNTFVVTVAAEVPPGLYEVRAGGLYGLSNPRMFVVGQREEINEHRASNTNNSRAEAEEIALGQIVNGHISGAADVDWFKFKGQKGQRVVITVQGTRIDSKLEGMLWVYDPSGKLLTYSQNQVRRDPDPLVDVTIPADGEYTIKLHDADFRGGSDYFYRLLASTSPHIDFVMPPAGVPGTTATFSLYGRNLPGGQPAGFSADGSLLDKLDVQIALPDNEGQLDTQIPAPSVEAGMDGITYTLDSPTGRSNPVTLYFATAPVAGEAEPNNEPAASQKITVPIEVAGQFQAVGDVDWYEFEAKTGEVLLIEVFGQRCGTTADPYLTVDRVTKNDKGEEQIQRLTAQDDTATNLAPFLFDTKTDDPEFRLQVPGDGLYRVSVRDRYFESRGDPRLVYRLSIRKEQPDFRLVALPTTMQQPNQRGFGTWSLGLRKGDNAHLDVMAFRRDGFNDTIEVWAEDLPQGVTCKGAKIGPGQTLGELVFTAAEDAPPWTGHVRVLGKAVVHDPERARAVEAAQAAIKPAADAVPKLDQAVAQAKAPVEQLQPQLAQAKEAAAAKPDDQGLANRAAELQKQFDAAAEKLQKAEQELAAGRQKVAETEAALKQAQDALAASAKTVSRPARPGAVVWDGAQNQSAVARLGRSIALAVLNETAPFQVTTEAFEFTVNQGSQILVPVKLAKREGFDADLNLQFVGFPNNANIQVQNKPIPKAKTDELYRLFVNTNAPPGTYTVTLRAQGQVSYSRNPARTEREKQRRDEAAKALETAMAELKQATEVRDAAAKKFTDSENGLKQSQQTRTEAEKRLNESKAALDKLKEELGKAAEAAKPELEKRVSEAEAALKPLAEALESAMKAVTDAEAALKSATDEKSKTEAAFKEAEARSKAADERKKAADKAFQDAENASKPQNRNYFPPSTPLVITVKKAPATLNAAVPSGGNLKRGEALEVKVTVNRQNGFAGPLTLSLPLPPGVAGLSAEAVTIPADQKEGVLKIQAAGEATEGKLENLVIRASGEFEGSAAVDAPISLTIQK
ncbi:MAG TPA: pre-peptidase C-terminal domain-containing protein [Planctomycetaceae bacterium]|nr:pre-peptidase C-terminal domain-containing protein [Planctomycetaceae bacterium]